MNPNRWREFQKRYFEELRTNRAAVDHLTDLVSAGKVTLLFGANHIEHNNAVALATSPQTSSSFLRFESFHAALSSL